MRNETEYGQTQYALPFERAYAGRFAQFGTREPSHESKGVVRRNCRRKEARPIIQRPLKFIRK